MYELEYVRKRKRKIRIAIIAGICTIVISTFVIIAFLGRFVGTFTVSLESNNVDISLSEKMESGNDSSFLRVETLAPFEEYTYSAFDRKFGDSKLDSDETPYTLGANYSATEPDVIQSFDFFKYTFFLKNVGTKPAMYNFRLNIVENVASEDGRSLLNTLRVALYEDGAKTIYGLADSVIHEHDGVRDYKPPISADEGDPEFEGYVNETFTSSETVTSFSGKQLDIGQTIRYTVVTWLEGFRSGEGQSAPKGAKIKLGVEINAYES